MRNSVDVAAAAAICMVCLAPVAVAAPVTLGALSTLAVDRPLTAPAIRVIEDYLTQQAEQFKTAKDFDAMLKVRQAVLDGYQVHSAPFYQLEYARVAGEQLGGLLDEGDVVRQVQAAIAITSMPQITILPALEKMAGHASPAVRHWGARGFRTAGRLLLQQGGDHARTMLAVLEKMGTEETSPVVAGDVLLALNPYPQGRKDQNGQLRKVQDKVLLAQCRDLQAGNEEAARSFERLAMVLAPDEGEDPRAVLQMLADLLEAGSQALVKADAKGPAVGTLSELLTTVESRLLVLTSTSQSPIQAILGDEKQSVAEKALRIRLNAVNEHWRKMLEGKGVKTRIQETEPPAATSSAPATGAATAPAGRG